jgi:hypothetical protein
MILLMLLDFGLQCHQETAGSPFQSTGYLLVESLVTQVQVQHQSWHQMLQIDQKCQAMYQRLKVLYATQVCFDNLTCKNFKIR